MDGGVGGRGQGDSEEAARLTVEQLVSKKDNTAATAESLVWLALLGHIQFSFHSVCLALGCFASSMVIGLSYTLIAGGGFDASAGGL